MAKIISPPKAPKIVEVPVAVETPVIEAETTPEPTADEMRVKNILSRRRGRLGTILTSISGVLSDTSSPSRKTLLGE